MLPLAIAMGALVWAVIGYALLQPNPPAPVGADGAGRTVNRTGRWYEPIW